MGARWCPQPGPSGDSQKVLTIGSVALAADGVPVRRGEGIAAGARNAKPPDRARGLAGSLVRGRLQKQKGRNWVRQAA